MTASKSCLSARRHSAKPAGVRSACSFRSKPEENEAPSPVSTTTEMDSSASA